MATKMLSQSQQSTQPVKTKKMKILNSSIDADGTHRWQSVNDFIPVQSKSFGSIAVGEIMSIEFDFVWWGRTNLPSAGKFEMFFRVGFDASISRGCDGQGARYPSFWLTGNNVDTMHVSVSNGTQCQPSLSLNSYGSISKGVSYHVSIAFNSHLVQVRVSGGGKADWSATWPRQPTPQQYIGAVVPIWWMSNKHPEDLPLYNRGNATFSNIILTSFTPTPAPTTAIPTTDAPTAPSFAPTTPYPTITPSATPTSLPTRNPSTQASTSPTIHPSDAPTTRAPTTAAPTTHPSETPTTNPSETPTTTHAPTQSRVTRSPTRTGETYPPTTQPTTLPTSIPTMNPTIEPTLNPTNKPTVDPTTKPTTAPSAQEKTEQLYYMTTTRYIRNTIEVTDLLRSQEEEEGEEETADRDEYEYVEITIFATVISLCFCTVISFLAYLTFKRKVREMQKKRKSSPKYHMELNGADMDQMPSKLELNGDSKSSNHGEKGEQVKLLKKNRKLDLSKYMEWSQDDVLYWILGLEDSKLQIKFAQYETVLAKAFAEQEFDGSCFEDVEKEDIKGWGIVNFKHRSSLYKHIRHLIAGNGADQYHFNEGGGDTAYI
eukprot:900010_1